MRYTTRNLESGQASISCDPQTAYNRLAQLEDWWELVEPKEIVRCKDCKHSQYDAMWGGYWCNGKERSDDWFCADGERRCTTHTE